MGKRKREPPQTIVVEQKEAARLLGVTDRTLRTWSRKPGFPDFSGGWRIEEIKAWAEQNTRAGSDEWHDAQQLQLALKAEQLEQQRAKTVLVLLDVAEREKRLIDRATVELVIAELLTKHGDWCTQLPDILRGKCCKQCRERVPQSLSDELNTRRNDLASDLAGLRSS
jgi:hypothetical protein